MHFTDVSISVYCLLLRMEWWCWVRLTDTRRNTSHLCFTSPSKPPLCFQRAACLYSAVFLFVSSHLAKSCTETSLQTSWRPVAQTVAWFLKGCTSQGSELKFAKCVCVCVWVGCQREMTYLWHVQTVERLAKSLCVFECLQQPVSSRMSVSSVVI